MAPFSAGPVSPWQTSSRGGAARRWWAVRRRSAAVLLAVVALGVGACDGGSDAAETLRWCVQNPSDVADEVLDPASGVATAAEAEWTEADSDLTFGSFSDLEQAMANGD